MYSNYNQESTSESPVSLRCFTVKKWVVSLWICIEILEAIVYIVLSAIEYDQHENSTLSSDIVKRRNLIIAIILWTLVIFVRLFFLYAVIWERFWLCLSYAVISFGHIVIIATSDGELNWISLIGTALVTIVSLLMVMDLFLIRQDQAEKEQQLITERQQQAQQLAANNDNNNTSNTKIFRVTLV